MTLGALLGWPTLMPLLLQSTSGALLYVLARRVSSGAIAFLAWTLWLLSPITLYFGASYFSETTTTVCWLAGWYALLQWREDAGASMVAGRRVLHGVVCDHSPAHRCCVCDSYRRRGIARRRVDTAVARSRTRVRDGQCSHRHPSHLEFACDGRLGD
jgi:hypothetical protein